jgi:hypothetical protein
MRLQNIAGVCQLLSRRYIIGAVDHLGITIGYAVRGRPSLSEKRDAAAEGANRPPDVLCSAECNWERTSRVQCGVRVMVAKPFVMMVVATLVGPAIGVGLFILMNNF